MTVTLSASPKTRNFPQISGSVTATAPRNPAPRKPIVGGPMIRGLMIGALVVSLGACTHHQQRPKKKVRQSAVLAPSKVTQIGVNAYLWRATLDTLSFMPLLQTDSNGGVIVTDWYSNPKNPGERVKVTVSILDQDLRADAVRVVASRQVLQAGGVWTDAPVEAATVQKLEDVILTRARDLRRRTIRG